ncbi:MAG: hypothetical protein L6Q97_06395 [Thermoanaerobaculia bacterium]|nr:hypothetical protein [Thermoanaerobaculia bacterium]
MAQNLGKGNARKKERSSSKEAASATQPDLSKLQAKTLTPGAYIEQLGEAWKWESLQPLEFKVLLGPDKRGIEHINGLYNYTLVIYDEEANEVAAMETFTLPEADHTRVQYITFSETKGISPNKSYDVLFFGKKLDWSEEFDPDSLDNTEALIDQIPLDMAGDFESPKVVHLERTYIPNTPDIALWYSILGTNLPFDQYLQVIEFVMNSMQQYGYRDQAQRLPFPGVEEYSLLLFATELFTTNRLRIEQAPNYFNGANHKLLPYYEQVIDGVTSYLADLNRKGSSLPHPSEDIWNNVSPDLRPARNFQRVVRNAEKEITAERYGLLSVDFERDRLLGFPAVELIWSYWMEQGHLSQTMNAINLRFQNIRGPREVEPLGRFDTAPLRPLSHLIWGYVQNEQHSVSQPRRFSEYDHAYGIRPVSRAIPPLRPVDSRSKFLESFHNLLYKCSVFFKEYDDTTRKPDGFPIYTSLKELHLILAEGNHNAYQHLTLTVRQEMLVQQYILARPEMREFLGGRPMMPYQERWMDKVDTMKMLQGWDPTSIIHYYDLAYCGEKVLLGIRYGNWNEMGVGADNASNWAVCFRDYIQKYIHSYQAVTGVDLSADAVETRPQLRAAQPALLIQERMQDQTITLTPRVPARRYY